MTTKILSKFRETLIDKLFDSIESPIASVQINASGTGYSNGEALVFSTGTAAGRVYTNASGEIVEVAISDGGNYLTEPTVTVATANGAAAALTAVLSNDRYYLYAGRLDPFEVQNVPDPVTENPTQAFYKQHRQMMFGVRLNTTNFAYMAKREVWTANTVYAEYDDEDPNLADTNFFVITSENKVYKCIDNNTGSPSTVEPTHTDILSLTPKETDGYRWKYMTTIQNFEMQKFATSNFFPVTPNANVETNAIDGAIAHVKMTSFGSGYPAASGEVVEVVNPNLLKIAANSSVIQGFYNSCTISVIHSGTNEIANRVISSYVANSSGKFVNVTPAFGANQVANTFQYTIGPTIRVVGDGTGFSARAIMNETSGAIARVEVIDAGSGYRRAPVVITTSPSFGSGAAARAIISPPGGHGSEIISELYVNHFGVSGSFTNSVSVGFPSEVSFRSVGLLKNPTKYSDPVTLYSGDTFRETVRLTVSDASVSQAQLNEYVVGSVSQARARVAFANTTVIVGTGYEGTFLPSEILTGEVSGAQYIVSTVTQTPDLALYSGEVLHIQNVQAIQRSNTSTESVKLVVKV